MEISISSTESANAAKSSLIETVKRILLPSTYPDRIVQHFIENYTETLLRKRILTLDDIDIFINSICKTDAGRLPITRFAEYDFHAICQNKMYVAEGTRLALSTDWYTLRARALRVGLFLTQNPLDPDVATWVSEYTLFSPDLFQGLDIDDKFLIEHLIGAIEDGIEAKTTLPEFILESEGKDILTEWNYQSNIDAELGKAIINYAIDAHIPLDFNPETDLSNSRYIFKHILKRARFRESVQFTERTYELLHRIKLISAPTNRAHFLSTQFIRIALDFSNYANFPHNPHCISLICAALLYTVHKIVETNNGDKDVLSAHSDSIARLFDIPKPSAQLDDIVLFHEKAYNSFIKYNYPADTYQGLADILSAIKLIIGEHETASTSHDVYDFSVAVVDAFALLFLLLNTLSASLTRS